jgi:dihydrofolate reductase
MKSFTAIAAMSRNRVIGAGGKIPWHLPEDFKWFKQLTTGHVIVMGRKTFESIGKPLPNRTTIVLSRSGFSHPGVLTVRSLDEIISACSRRREETESGKSEMHQRLVTSAATTALETSDLQRRLAGKEVFICGGAEVYRQALPLCSDLYLTLVKRQVEGDAFFPPFEDRFELVEEILDRPEFKTLHYRNRALGLS